MGCNVIGNALPVGGQRTVNRAQFGQFLQFAGRIQAKERAGSDYVSISGKFRGNSFAEANNQFGVRGGTVNTQVGNSGHVAAPFVGGAGLVFRVEGNRGGAAVMVQRGQAVGTGYFKPAGNVKMGKYV